MTSSFHDDPGGDDLETLDQASDEERREAEALARALAGEDASAPTDAASTAAFVTTVARTASLDASVASVEREVFGAKARTNVRRLPGRTLAMATALIASAAGVLIVVRQASPTLDSTAPAPTNQVAEASRSAEPTSASGSVAASVALLDAERALLVAPVGSQADAFATFRDAWSRRRDERFDAMLANGGRP